MLSTYETEDLSIKEAVTTLQRFANMICYSDAYSEVEAYIDLEIYRYLTQCMSEAVDEIEKQGNRSIWYRNVAKMHFFAVITKDE